MRRRWAPPSRLWPPGYQTLCNFIENILINHSLQYLPALQIGFVQLFVGRCFVISFGFVDILFGWCRCRSALLVLLFFPFLFGLFEIGGVGIVDVPLQDIGAVCGTWRWNGLRFNGLRIWSECRGMWIWIGFSLAEGAGRAATHPRWIAECQGGSLAKVKLID